MEPVTTWIAARPRLVIPGLIDSNKQECHLTLAFLGKTDPEAVKAKLEDYTVGYYGAHSWPRESLVCEASGTAEWIIPDGRKFQVILVQPSIPLVGQSIYDERARIVQKLEMDTDGHPKFEVNDAFPFVPHITMPYRPATRDHHGLPIIDARYMFTINELFVCYSNPDYMEADGENNGVPSHFNWEIGKPIPGGENNS